jgi:amino-acid N-acetyltransferase
MSLVIRKAASSDIKDIKKILSCYYLDTDKVGEDLPEFIVAVSDGTVVACASLDTMELRSIAVLPAYRNRGIGSKLVDSILEGVTDIVYLRTASPVFFEKKGFYRLKNAMKKIIWKECADCDRFDKCTQTLMELRPAQ